jgi:hypothetical protein
MPGAAAIEHELELGAGEVLEVDTADVCRAAWCMRDHCAVTSKAVRRRNTSLAWLMVSFPKIRSGRIRAVRENQTIIRCDVCDHLPTVDVARVRITDAGRRELAERAK